MLLDRADRGAAASPARERLARYGALNGALCSLRSVELTDGRARTLRVLEVRTAGGLDFDVMLDHGLDIGRCFYRGVSVGWQSPTGHVDVRHLDSGADGFESLRGFSGLVMTGGLDHTFAPRTVDAQHLNYGNRRAVAQPLHGRIARIPAEGVTWGEHWSGDSPVLWIAGQVRQVSIFGEDLVLHRRVEVPIFGSEFSIHDVVENLGYASTPHALLYHVNVGWPLLDEHAQIALVDAGREQLWGEAGADPSTMPSPAAQAPESVWAFQQLPLSEGHAEARLTGPTSGLTFTMRYKPSQLPYLLQWQLPRAGSYALAFEPSTGMPGGDRLWLEPREARRYETHYAIAETDDPRPHERHTA